MLNTSTFFATVLYMGLFVVASICSHNPDDHPTPTSSLKKGRLPCQKTPRPIPWSNLSLTPEEGGLFSQWNST